MTNILELVDISKYINHQEYIIKNINITVKKGEIIALVGPSGSGKSTLLQIAGLLDTPTSGKIFFNGREVELLSDMQRTFIRRHHIGFVYQFHHLIPELSIKNNIALPQIISNKRDIDAVENIMKKLSIDHISHNNISVLSGGEKQRIAIARALIHCPQLVLADEPTGNLDYHNSNEVFNLLIKMAREDDTAVVVVTHDRNLAQQTDQVLYL